MIQGHQVHPPTWHASHPSALQSLLAAAPARPMPGTGAQPQNPPQVVTAMASRGLRCICLAYADYPADDPSRPPDFFTDPERAETGLTAAAIVGIKDPVRWGP